MEDLDELLEELALACEADPSVLDRLCRAELTSEQWMEAEVGLDDQVCCRERAFVDFESSVVDPCVDDDLPEPELVAGS